MTTITIELPESVFSAFHSTPQEFGQEMRIAAAIRWYELGKISQGKGAEIAGLTRAAFMEALSRDRVSPYQYTEQELKAELMDAD